ncbi:MAG: 6-bladed beta-propeller [Nitrospirae bacterium]|nr:MAG: 6-bladed beta-propeller [Nitrospirota bacterium]
MLKKILKKTKDVDRNSGLFTLLLLIAAAVFAVGSVAEAAISATNASYISTKSYGNPIRIAKDKAGLLYATVPADGKVLIYSQSGMLYNTIESSFNKPVSIAVDDLNRIYVGDSSNGSVTVIDPTGKFLFKLGAGNGEFGLPSDIAIASNGKSYVVDSSNNRVKIYNNDGQSAGSFGIACVTPISGVPVCNAQGQFNFPTGIAVDDIAGEVYVVDSNNARVQVFDLSGSFKRSFGSFGDAAGQFSRPQGIAVAEGYVYVVDSYHARIQVYDLSGNYIMNIGSYGSGSAAGALKVPMDVLKSGIKLYITNSDNARIESYDIKDPNGLVVTPSWVALDVNIGTAPSISKSVNVSAQGENVLSWTARTDVDWLNFPSSGDTSQPNVQVSLNSNVSQFAEGVYNGRIMFKVQGGVDYVLMVTLNIQRKFDLSVSPASLNIAYNQNLAVATKALNISSGIGNLPWTAVANVNWIDIAPSGMMPTNVDVALNQNANQLAAGVYSGLITINAPDATNSIVTVPVTLSVKKISVNPESVSITHKKGSALENITVAVAGNSRWTASKDASNWFSIAQVGDGVLSIALNQSVEQMSGLNNANITITAVDGDAINSPLVVPVSLRAISAGKITVASNIEQASFNITGAANLGGAGRSWAADEVVPGSYTITFNNIRGYRKPAAVNFVVESGKSVALNGLYRQNPVANVVVVAQGPGPRNDANVKVLDLNGNLINEFKAFSSKYGAKVAMGDVDGDGSGDVVVGSGAGPDIHAAVKVFKYNGSLLASIGPIADTAYGANVAAGDIDGDGISEIVVSMFDDTTKTNIISVYSYDISNRLIEKGRVDFSDGSRHPANVALGDVNNDGRLELIVVSSGHVRIYATNDNMVPELLSAAALTANSGADYATQMTVGAGDVNGDGADEVLLGYVDNNDSVVGVYNGNLSSFMYAVNVFANGKSAPSISCMDWSGDGVMELLAGQGAASDGRSAARIFGSDGSLVKEINAFRASKYGVNAVFGVIK